MNQLYKIALRYAEQCLRSLLSESDQERNLGLYVDIESTLYNLHRFVIKGEYPKNVMCYVTYDGLRMKWSFTLYSEGETRECNNIDLMFD